MPGRTMLSRQLRERAVTGRLVHAGDRRVLDLGRGPVTLGRGPEGVGMVLPGAQVSRSHARLELAPGVDGRASMTGSSSAAGA